MNPTRCEECHEYFDRDEYAVCPFCGVESKEKSVSRQPDQNESSRRGWFLRKSKTTAPKKQESVEKPAALSDDMPTQAMWSDPGAYPQPNNEDIPKNMQNAFTPIPGPGGDTVPEPMPAPKPTPAPDPAPAPVAERPRQDTFVPKISPAKEAKTLGFFSIDSGADTPVSTEPVVGWLVSVKGNHLGESFCLYTGRNFIGRSSSDNAIVLTKDGHVSSIHHASVVFEPRKRVYTVRPGENTSLTYLNGAEVESSTKLNDRDIIELGQTQLMFIGLCGEHFAWEDYIGRE